MAHEGIFPPGGPLGLPNFLAPLEAAGDFLFGGGGANHASIDEPFSFDAGGGITSNNSRSIKRALAVFGIPVDSEIAQRLFAQWEGLPDVAPVLIQDALEELRTNQTAGNEARGLIDTAAAAKRTQLANIDEAETRTQASIDRLGNVLGPGGLESDAEFASLLAQAERPLGGIVRDTRSSAASGLASAGLRSAGKASSGVRRAELGVQGARGQIRSGVLGNVKRRQDELQNFVDRDIFDARNQVESGSLGPTFAASSALTGIGPLDVFGPSAGTVFDIQAGRKGFAQQDFGLATQFLLGLGQQAGDSTSDFLRFLSSPGEFGG